MVVLVRIVLATFAVTRSRLIITTHRFNTPMTEIYGLLGRKLGHSFSRRFFSDKFEAEQRDAQYLNYEIPEIGCFEQLIEKHPDLHGLNVTIPYKLEIIPYLDALSPEAAEVGAVNVIQFSCDSNGHRRLIGHNTDLIGFRDTLRPLLQPYHLKAGKALILGTGGASKAVAAGLRQCGLQPCFVSRTAAPGRFRYEDLTPEIIAGHLVIVNTTPLGMWPDVESCPALPYHLLGPEHLCYDLVYNPDPTVFMQRSAAQGAITTGGLAMLELQAIESWKIWNPNG